MPRMRSGLVCRRLIPQRLAGFQRVLNSFLRFLFTAERFETFAFQVEDVLLAHRSAGRNVASAKDLRNLSGEFHLVLGDVLALAHQVNAHFESGENVFSGAGMSVRGQVDGILRERDRGRKLWSRRAHARGSW